LAERLQAQEQEELSDAEKATLFQQLLEKRRKHFAAKRAKEKLEHEITKKQNVDDDNEKAELKQFTETILDKEEVAIDAIPLAVKSSRIVDWKIHKEGKKIYYQISTFLDDAVYADLHVSRKEVSSYTTYTFNDAGKEALIDCESEMAYQLCKLIKK
nr:hypothetical protein [Tanacetum cinerariifolium]